MSAALVAVVGLALAFAGAGAVAVLLRVHVRWIHACTLLAIGVAMLLLVLAGAA